MSEEAGIRAYLKFVFIVTLIMRIDIPEIDPTLWLRLHIEARHRGTNVSTLLTEAIHFYLGIKQPSTIPPDPSSLHRLAGTWTQEDAEEFEQNTDWTRQIDPDIWT